MSASHPGGCLCGAIRYLLLEEPLAFYACHCTDCQRHTGSAFGLSMIVRERAIRLLEGEPRRYDVELPDGRVKRGRFCERCATRLWGEPARFPQLRVLRPGTLDAPGAFEPVGQIWTRSARSWIALPTASVSFEAQPPDPGALLRAWQERAEQADRGAG